MPGRATLMRGIAGLAVAAGVAFGAVLLVQQLRTQESAPGAVLARSEFAPIESVSVGSDALVDQAEPYVTPPASDTPGGIAPAELANYLVAHYGYASPLVRRSVGAGLISVDDPALVDAVPPEDKAGQ